MTKNHSLYHRREGFLKASDGLQLFFQTWSQENSRGHILITHGQGEHSECYHRLVDALHPLGWSFWSWDLRGHGRSEGKRGYARTFSDYLEDHQLVLRKFLAETPSDLPRVMLAHSMGGLIQLRNLCSLQPQGITAQVYSAPQLGLALPVPMWKQQGAHILDKIYPQMTLWNEIRYTQLTRDPEVIHEFELDVLRHNRISPGVYLGMIENMAAMKENATKVTWPTLFQLPEQDPVVDSTVGQSFFEQMTAANKKICIYGDGARHEMYNDIHRKFVYEDLKNFIKQFDGASK